MKVRLLGGLLAAALFAVVGVAATAEEKAQATTINVEGMH